MRAEGYTEAEASWLTPGGNLAQFRYRLDSSDWNTINSVMGGNDEYALPRGLSGWALDCGAHIGPVTVALALDNPELRIIAVEPVPDNVRLLRENVERNGLADRVAVIDGAIAGPNDATVQVWHGYVGNETAEHHAFIGNSSLAYAHGGEAVHDETIAEAWSLSRLIALAGVERIAWLKVDTEGAEYAFLADPAVARVDVITGEFHNVPNRVTGGVRGRGDIVALLVATHDVTFSGPEAGPGGFVAVRR